MKAYLDDKRSQQLEDSTISKLETIFQKQLLSFCKDNAIYFLADLDLAQLRKWRASWKDGALAASKRQERVRGVLLLLPIKRLDTNQRGQRAVQDKGRPEAYRLLYEAVSIETIPSFFTLPRQALRSWFHCPTSLPMPCVPFHPDSNRTHATSSGRAMATRKVQSLIGRGHTENSLRSQTLSTKTTHPSAASLTCSGTVSAFTFFWPVCLLSKCLFC